MENNDKEIEEQLKKCVSKEGRQSFFLFAGAGSGKTYSLVNLLAHIKETWGNTLMSERRQVAVITYTNAATDEIMRRMDYSTLFHVSTIHSFIWDVINPFQIDIKRYYLQRLQNEMDEIAAKMANPRTRNTKSYEEKYQSLLSRKEEKERINKFVYNPNGDNLDANSLNHQDVIDIGASMIMEHPILQKVIVQQYPFMLIDESQDTKSILVDAFFEIQGNYPNDFTLGFIGDIKQRIYMDGKAGIKNIIPKEWETPQKKINYRCAKRIVEVANKISVRIDGSEQEPRENAPQGYARLFLKQIQDDMDKEAIETQVRQKMHDVTHDDGWNTDCKVLTLEHRMAAVRLGFADFYDLFAKIPKYNMSFLQGEMPEMSLFSKNLFPFLFKIKQNDEVGILNILKKSSPLLEAANDKDYVNILKDIKQIVDDIKTLDIRSLKVESVVEIIMTYKLFRLPVIIIEAFNREDEICEEDSIEVQAWTKAMKLPLYQLMAYDDYVNERTSYATHQGVKGLEFPRVMVLIDDNEAKGFLFSYDKLFEVSPLSATDIKNHGEGKENSIDRTARLFYVTCTRAKESLAILMYTSNPEKAKETAIKNNWFTENEIDILT